jgi:hypothetical protein
MRRATEADVDRLLAHPDSVADFLNPPGDGPRMREVRPKGIFGFLLRLTPITITEQDPDDDTPFAEPDPEREINIDKAWHGLHFLLTGTADEGEGPASFLMQGGEALDDEGRARAFRPVEVERIARHLQALSQEQLAGRFDGKRMNELDIYPGRIWQPESGDHDTRQWLLDFYEEVREFMVRVAAARECVIVEVS